MSSGPVVVVGASVSGLVTAVALARRGVPVHLVDADPVVGASLDRRDDSHDDLDRATAPIAATVPGEADRRQPRRATPQAAHSHAFLARCRELLRAEAPHVLAELQRAGCRELRLVDHRPATVPRHAPHRDDEELVVLAARRTTFEAVLRQATSRRPEVRLAGGRRVTGLVVEATRPVTQVRGVAFEDGTTVAARFVIDATGRRTPMPGWLAAHGIPVTEQREECGIAYFTRFYRRLPGTPDLPLDRGFAAGGSFDRYSCLVFPGDAGTFSVTFGVLPEDRALRRLLDGAAFDAAVRAIPSLAPWVDGSLAEPISDVRMMAGLLNQIRRVSRDGRPTVLGWTAVGDAAATTNPAHSRGCSLGAVHAVGVATAVADHQDPGDLAEACATVVEREQAPWVADSIEQDRQRLARWRPSPVAPPPDGRPGDLVGSGGPAAPGGPGGSGSPGRDGEPGPGVSGTGSPGRTRLTNGEAYLAAQHDAYVWRRFNRLQQLLDRPDDVLTDPRVVARVRAVQAATQQPSVALDGASYVFQAARPPTRTLDGPSHDELVELLAGATVA